MKSSLCGTSKRTWTLTCTCEERLAITTGMLTLYGKRGSSLVCTLMPCNKCQLLITLLCGFLDPHKMNKPQNHKYILSYAHFLLVLVFFPLLGFNGNLIT